ncbi:hypothetical protein F0562_009996 [Nyssa sinensis]|uniref:Uncharacterized protein n=1 Tax=Nyssa sinensis TaxID=561372 RepID=A0A5J4ZXM4_9ASTE|nr:hypothetical protein F0562_009996 [Nyssa sinensis]
MNRIESETKILAGNARKVSAIQFERVNHDNTALDAKEVTRLVPKFMKRKWSSDDDSDRSDYDEVPFQNRSDDDLSHGYVIAEHEDDHDAPAPR